MQRPKQILFLTLKIFSITGGIEKVCKIAGKVLNESYTGVKIFSLHDDVPVTDKKYFPQNIFTGFEKKKIRFIFQSIREGVKHQLVFISHINLLSIGYLIKFFSPRTKLVLFAHGIEVWQPLSSLKKKMLNKCDRILAVSNYTREMIIQQNEVDPAKCTVLNNCLDPFLPDVIGSEAPAALYRRYHLTKENFILLTVTRIAADEQYKGLDNVITSLSNLINEFPNLRYLVAGKYDVEEKERLDTLIAKHNLTGKVIFAGYVPDEELASHYTLADVYIMPSNGEGFGIVFIEAMYYGLPVIAGNKDGSTDALCNGELGLLLDPENITAITAAIKKIVNDTKAFIPDHSLLMKKFGYPVYKENLNKETAILL